jgi:thiol-disulfide isomerase/thioredoxin
MSQRALELLWCIASCGVLLLLLFTACNSGTPKPCDFPDGPTPLTVDEFEKLQQDLRKKRDEEKPAEFVTILDFYADWCSPCRAARKDVSQLEHDGYPITRLDTDLDSVRGQLAAYNVKVLPTFIVMLHSSDFPYSREVYRTHDVQQLNRKLAEFPKPKPKP